MKKGSIVIQSVLLFITLLTGPPLVAQRPASARGQERLIREVRRELVMLPYYSVFDNLEYRVEGEVVTLLGQVTRPTLKSDAARAVMQIEGISNVVNQIEVLPLSPADDRIRRAVYRALFSEDSSLFRYAMGAVPPIHIIVKNGNVTLVGVVDNEADKTTASSRAIRVSGLFSLTNSLTVKKE